MAYEIRMERRAMLDCAVKIIETQGYKKLTARNLANELGISTQPIYREFGDMEGLLGAASERAGEELSLALCGEAEEQAAEYIRFAVEHKNLFDFLFRSRQTSYAGLDDLSHKLLPDIDIIERLMEITGLDRETVYKQHLYIWMAIHGLASMCADNDLQLTDGEIEEFVIVLSRALGGYFKGASEWTH